MDLTALTHVPEAPVEVVVPEVKKNTTAEPGVKVAE
jgi:hypothetical protein